MSTGVEYVRKICAERKIPVSQLEKELGFSNGYLNPKKLQNIPYSRAASISSYLKVPIELILGVEEEKTPTENGEREFSKDDLKFALWGDSSEIDDADLADVLRYAAFIKERKQKNDG